MCVGESNPCAALGALQVSRITRRLSGCARLHVGYLLRTLLSVQQLDLPVRPLNEGVDLAKLPRKVVGPPA